MKKVLTIRAALVASAALAPLIGAGAAYAQDFPLQEAAYVHGHHAAPAQANPRGDGNPRVSSPNDVVTGNRVIGRDPDPFIQEEILRHSDSGWPD
jgi:hypothetical protein